MPADTPAPVPSRLRATALVLARRVRERATPRRAGTAALGALAATWVADLAGGTSAVLALWAGTGALATGMRAREADADAPTTVTLAAATAAVAAGVGVATTTAARAVVPVLLVAAGVAVAAVTLVGARRLWLRAGGPQPEQVWWARVGYRDGQRDEDGRASKDRPVFVLTGDGRTYQAVTITSQRRRRHQPGYVPVPDVVAGRASFANVADPVTLPRRAFRRQAPVRWPRRVRQALVDQVHAGT